MSDPPDQLTLRQGEEVSYPLPSLAGAGYRWEAAVDDAAVADATTRFDDPAETSSGAAAFSANELLFIRGLSVGQTRVRCRQRRRWESEEAAVGERLLAITVIPAAHP